MDFFPAILASFIEIVFGLLLCLIFGFIGRDLAKKRGKNKYLGFFYGFIFGPLGLVLILLLKKTPSSPCWYCGKEVKG